MQLIVYIVLFIILSPRYFFSFMKSASGRIGFKEVVSHAAVFGFAVVIMQWISKRYGVFEGFQAPKAAGGATLANSLTGRNANTPGSTATGGLRTTGTGGRNTGGGGVAAGAAGATRV